ncbi:MAG: efflux RND transporter periplasmic adaptor subunit [Parvularcula sp.]
MNYSIHTVAFIVASLLTACNNSNTPPAPKTGEVVQSLTPEQIVQYTCPMHPHFFSDDPDGHCPICGMNLVPVAQTSQEDPGEILYYKNPMGKPDTSPVPKKDSMGMDYIPVYAREMSSGAVTVPSEMIQTMGIRTAKVKREEIVQRRRFFGTIEADQRLEAEAVSRSEGWIESLSIRSEGETVEPGARLYEIYSPDLMAAQKDYLNALNDRSEKRLRALRQRLISLGMQDPAIKTLRDKRVILERVPIFAEAGGTVTALHVRQGDYVKPGMKVLTLQSYDTVWVIASIPEQDIPFISHGQNVELYIPSAPRGGVTGAIEFVYPQIDAATRTRRARIVLDNKEGSYLPGAYADISVLLSHGDRLAIPTEAILHDQDGTHVVLAMDDGRFSSRSVEMGISADGQAEIVSGLIEGEEVVTSGQFMFDSEINLRAGLQNRLSSTQAALTPDLSLAALPIDDATLAKIDHITDLALYFHEALVDKYQIAPNFVDPALRIIASLRAEYADTKLVPILDHSKTAIENAKVAKTSEALASALAALMNALDPWLLEGMPVHYQNAGLTLYQDPQSGRRWLQSEGLPRNPYTNAEPSLIPWPQQHEDDGDRLSEDPAAPSPHDRH